MSRTGSLVNNILSENHNPDPKIDMGATILRWSDRSPGTIVAIRRYTKGPKKGQLRELIIREDTATLVKGSEQDGSAQYEYSENENGTEWIVTKNRSGAWRTKGGDYIHIGSRARYHDPHF